MTKKLFLFLSLLLLSATTLSAQSRYWSLTRKGNKAFYAEQYDQADDYFLRAQAQKPACARAIYNIGTAQMGQRKANEAMATFAGAAQAEEDPLLRSMSHYNMGFIAQSSALEAAEEQEKQQYLRQAIEHYKNALRDNPHDDNARYNLALAQKQLKDSEQQQPPQQQPQQDPQQNKEQQDKDKQDQQQPQQQDQPQDKQDQPQDRSPQTQQLLNLSRQSEQQTRERLNATPRRSQRQEKNW